MTNISTSIYALLPLFKEDSPEYKKLVERLKQICVNQSKQIDKTKIGQDVKCIPKVWTQFQSPKIDPDTGEVLSTAEEIEEIEFNNSILADRKPYFFKYNYRALDKEYREFFEKINYNIARKLGVGVTINDLLQKDFLTPDEQTFVDFYHKRAPVIDTDCEMNLICHHIEEVNFNIKSKVKEFENFDYTLLYSNPNFTLNQKLYQEIRDLILERIKSWKTIAAQTKSSQVKKNLGLVDDTKQNKEALYDDLRKDLLAITNNVESLANHLVYLFYQDKPNLEKNTLWGIAGEWIFDNVKTRKFNSSNSFAIDFPIKDTNGNLKFLYETFQIQNITIEKEQEEEVVG